MLESEEMIICGLLGSQEVGKTSFLNKYLKKVQSEKYSPTVAVEFTYGSYQCQEGTRIRIKCWDTSGEKKYEGMVCYHLKEADIILIFYDISDTFSFRKVKDWATRLKKEEAKPIALYLVGNKTDLIEVDPNLRRVTTEEGQAMALEIGAEFVEISVKNETELQFVEDAFQKVLNERAEKVIAIKKNSIDLNNVLIEGQEMKAGQNICNCRVF